MNEFSEYEDIILSFKELRVVVPDEQFVSRMRNRVLPEVKSHFLLFPALSIQLVILFFIISFVTGVGVAVAAEYSKSGSILYPLKNVLEKIKKTSSENTMPYVPPTPEEHTQGQISPTPTLAVSVQGAKTYTSVVSSTPTIPTPSPSVTVNLNTVPQENKEISVSLSTETLSVTGSVTPPLQGEGSVDIQADTPLLPDLKLNVDLKPKLKLGL